MEGALNNKLVIVNPHVNVQPIGILIFLSCWLVDAGTLVRQYLVDILDFWLVLILVEQENTICSDFCDVRCTCIYLIFITKDTMASISKRNLIYNSQI